MTDTPDLKTTAGKIADLAGRLAESRSPMGVDAIAAAHDAGSLTARERVEALVDPDSFVETDALARHRSTDFGREHDRPYTDGVITGYGTVDGRKLCVVSHDGSIFGATMGEVYADKVVKLYDLAIKTGVPIVTIAEQSGPRVQEGIVTLAGYGQIMSRITQASGLVPQLSVVVGDTAGIAAFAPTMADVVIMSRAATLHQAAAHVADADVTEYGSADVHATAGTAHLVADTDAEAIAVARDVLAYLPVNNRAEAPRTAADITAGAVADNVTDRERELDALIPDAAAQAYDMLDVISHVVDPDSFLELSANYASNILTGFAHIEGRSVGIVANQPLALAGALDGAGSEKAASFIRLCDAFNTPIVEFVDSPGFVPTPEEERAGVLRRGSKLGFAFAEASVGKLTVITRKAIGPAYVLMGSKDLGADLAYAWPTAEIAVTQASQAALAIYGPEATEEQTAELEKQFLHPYAAAEHGLIDAVIEPSHTRGLLIEGLRLLERKIYTPEPKKHGNINL